MEHEHARSVRQTRVNRFHSLVQPGLGQHRSGFIERLLPRLRDWSDNSRPCARPHQYGVCDERGLRCTPGWLYIAQRSGRHILPVRQYVVSTAYGANGVYYRVVQVPCGTPRVDLLRSRGATFGVKLTADWRRCASHGMVGVAAGSLSASGPRFAFQHNRKELGLLDHRCPASVLDNHWRRAYDQRRRIEL
ncbi:hypothetical protein P3T25_001587 [Paraburkholderia sp. GAS32]